MQLPDYLEEEIQKYKFEKMNNKCSIITYQNVVSYIGLAYMNGWFSQEDKEKLYQEIDSV